MKRSCGTCNLCCTVIGVTELAKPANEKCCHLGVLGRCTIYADRPTSCREFECLWLLGVAPQELFPAKSRVVAYEMKKVHDRHVLYLHVPRLEPNAWNQGQCRQWVQRMILDDWLVIVVCGEGRTLMGRGSEEFVLTATGEAP